MVKRDEFEKELIELVAPAITHAQDVVKAKYGFRFEATFDWRLTKGSFEDEPTSSKGISFGG